jgi:hypothetical protein
MIEAVFPVIFAGLVVTAALGLGCVMAILMWVLFQITW